VGGEGEDLQNIALDCQDDVVSVTNPPGTLYSGHADGVVLATDQSLPESLVSQVMKIRLRGVPILDLADFYEQFLLRVPVMQLKDHWFALTQGFSLLHHEIEWKIKRLLDVLVSAAGVLLALPLIVVTVVLIKVTSRGPAFYSQLRCGHHGTQFRLHKFRTMVVDAETEGARWTQPGDPRITGVGRLLRRTRLDELPQLWNVLIGDMSFIGPRPEQPDFVRALEKEIPYYDLRHLVKPGITGWAQVMYGYGASVEDAKNKLEFDLYYIKNYSLALDAYIALRTLRVVMFGSGR
jgi:exopolysaccharide biosynthesis polyprenyl glycosylphosphotransferase